MSCPRVCVPARSPACACAAASHRRLSCRRHTSPQPRSTAPVARSAVRLAPMSVRWRAHCVRCVRESGACPRPSCNDESRSAGHFLRRPVRNLMLDQHHSCCLPTEHLPAVCPERVRARALALARACPPVEGLRR